MNVMSLTQAQAQFGEIQNGQWGDQAKHCSLFEIPEDIAPDLVAWINVATGKPVVHIYCLTEMQAALEGALRAAVARGLASQLKTFDGCFEIRDVRAMPGQTSAHSYAGAIDINAATNQLGTPGDMTDELAACFTEVGFVWGKTFKRCDPMHFSWLGW